MLNFSKISSPWSALQARPSSSQVTPSVMRTRGQWGLLGGSSNLDKQSGKSKQSKLANLARSSRGAFERKGIIYHKANHDNMDAVSRLAALNSASQAQQPVPSSPSSDLPRRESLSRRSDSAPLNEAQKPKHVDVSTDPHCDHLLAHPSILAKSLFQLWAVPRDMNALLHGMYANFFFLTVSNESQVKDAFSTASPDDIVLDAQSHKKCTRTVFPHNVVVLPASTRTDVKPSPVTTLVSDVETIDLNAETFTHPSIQPFPKGSRPKKKSLDEIKERLKSREGSSVSFVIIGRKSRCLISWINLQDMWTREKVL
jgi:hypothetical protein